MQLATLLAGAVVGLAALYLLGFGALAVAVPSQAAEFLRGFASSVRLHVLELIVRFVVGAAFVGYAPQMQFGDAFYMFGWVLGVTTLALAVLPWRWHQRFAHTAVPAAVRYLPLIGITSFLAGAFVFWAVAGAALHACSGSEARAGAATQRAASTSWCAHGAPVRSGRRTAQPRAHGDAWRDNVIPVI